MKLIIVIMSILTLTSCGANKYLTSSTTKSTEINNVGYFQPLSYIQFVEKGNKAAFSDSLSKVTSENLSLLLDKNKTSLRLSQEISFPNDTIKAKVEQELTYLVRVISSQKKLDGIPLPHTIDSILKNNNQRFALATIATGFGRRKGNYGGQVAKGVAVGILTLGMVVPTPIKSNLAMYAIIFDAEKGEITYYKNSLPVEKEPTDEQIMDQQLMKLFNGYLYDSK